VGTGCGQVVGASRCCAGEPERGAVRAGEDLHVHPVSAVFHRVVRLVRGPPVGGNQGPVGDDEVAFAPAHQGLMQARCPGGQDLERLVHVSPRRRLGHPEPRSYLGERLVLAQVSQDEQGLFEAAQLPPRRVSVHAFGRR
jgi:hypothetical protein